MGRTIAQAMSKQLKERITDAVRALAEGNGATLDEVPLQPDLMSLGCVVAEASDHGRKALDLDRTAAMVALLLEEAANALEEHPHAGTSPNRAAAARAALGLEPGTQGKPLRGRRGQPGRNGTIARWLSYQPASLSKPRQDGRSAFDALIEDVAEYVTRREVAYQVAEQRLAQQARRPPLESAMRIDWLARFERYYRVWSALSGLSGDLKTGLAAAHADHGDDVDYFARKSLYYNARFLYELQQYQRDGGGLWILPNPTAEQLVADAVWMLRKPTPLSEVDESMLRLAIASWDELAAFFDATYRDTALKRITADWQAWMQACSCDLENASEDCTVHQCLHWTDTFILMLDAQWDDLADWYQVARPGSAVDLAGDTSQD